MLAKILRYNARHHLFFPCGYDGKTAPQLNPICSSSHGANGKRTKAWHEPLWIYRLRRRMFSFAGAHCCPSRVPDFRVGTPDEWNIGMDGNRTCSFCGSIHHDDLLKIAEKSKTDDRFAIEGTTKSYKVYVRQPGVMNAGQGAIKFYGWHRPEVV